MILFEDGDWYFYRDSPYLCLRHTACKDKEGVCACVGRCDTCNVAVPDEIKGFFALVKWKR